MRVAEKSSTLRTGGMLTGKTGAIRVNAATGSNNENVGDSLWSRLVCL